jgi:hypothetical protein
MCIKRTYSRTGALYSLMCAMEMHNDYRPIRYYRCDHCKSYHLTSMDSVVNKAALLQMTNMINLYQLDF